MYKIINKRDLSKAEQNRECICCGKNTASVKKIEFTDSFIDSSYLVSMWLCKNCINEIAKHM